MLNLTIATHHYICCWAVFIHGKFWSRGSTEAKNKHCLGFLLFVWFCFFPLSCPGSAGCPSRAGLPAMEEERALCFTPARVRPCCWGVPLPEPSGLFPGLIQSRSVRTGTVRDLCRSGLQSLAAAAAAVVCVGREERGAREGRRVRSGRRCRELCPARAAWRCSHRLVDTAF